MAKAAVETHGVSIRLACECLCVSETCYRYEAKLDVENQRIADCGLAASVDPGKPQMGFWFVLPVFAEREGPYLESQAGLPHLSGA